MRAAVRRWRGPATWCCSRPLPPAWTCSPRTRLAGTPSRAVRALADGARAGPPVTTTAETAPPSAPQGDPERRRRRRPAVPGAGRPLPAGQGLARPTDDIAASGAGDLPAAAGHRSADGALVLVGGVLPRGRVVVRGVTRARSCSPPRPCRRSSSSCGCRCGCIRRGHHGVHRRPGAPGGGAGAGHRPDYNGARSWIGVGDSCSSSPSRWPSSRCCSGRRTCWPPAGPTCGRCAPADPADAGVRC